MERQADELNMTMQERVKVDWDEIKKKFWQIELKELSNSRKEPVFH